MNRPWITVFCAFVLGLIAGFPGYAKHKATQDDVQEFFATHKIGNSPDYAVVKNGTDYLAVVYGMSDDRSTCMDLIKPYNENVALSSLPGTYSCVPLNH